MTVTKLTLIATGKGGEGHNNKGMEWDGFIDSLHSVDFSEMKIRKVR